MVEEGSIEVNGVIVRDPDLWLDLRKDRLTRNGKPLKAQQKIYLALHKPRGVVTTRSDERGRPTVYDLLPPEVRWVFPVGRLDKDSSGLLLLTNDTEFGEAITSPERKVAKTYLVTLDHPLDDHARKSMESGMTLPDGTVLTEARVEPTGNPAQYQVSIREGKNRQIRRMCDQLGYAVRRLHRTTIGDIQLGNLKEGDHRALSEEERLSVLRKR